MKLDDAQQWVDHNGPDCPPASMAGVLLWAGSNRIVDSEAYFVAPDLDDAQQWIDHNGPEGTP